ncbi:glucan biosynthesis protein [Thalassococcus sp. S3]|uniref:glucan biosynthesis protein n=1 Tax=Thalassococcus sp. S3 TaxID=2017482 RepID=UPI00102407CB|nr:glucan biosynthesis protein [Thalassococcus sp. S3]QBF31771.1 glucan biosynthesis protein D [Thalassococcus sp. S3]
MTDMFRPTRRGAMAMLLGTASVLVAGPGRAEEPTPFSFDWLKERMRTRAEGADVAPEALQSFLADLDYDGYRSIAFRPEMARWRSDEVSFQLHAFHPGWLYKEPVVLHEVVNGTAQEMTFSTADFEYRKSLAGQVPEDAELPGIAGFRLHHPLNTANVFDELIVFVGASYFRALGRGNSYGLSARGLAINTWLDGPEEFPRFSEFWMERPAPGQQHVVIYAALDSTSVTGAYRFEVHPGADTVIDVEAHLYFREEVAEIGLAPLTSMFFFDNYTQRDFNDYRPQVHDSDALKIVRSDGDVLVRPLNNPVRVAGSYFAETGLQSFGLIQRNRDYDDYQDAEARYHDRPSVMIDPLDDWGPGAIRLVEIPAELEIEDNIVLFWVPEGRPQAGEERSYRYRMHWGALPPDEDGALAWVAGTKAGHGGPSGVPIENENMRKFVIDFEGGLLGRSAPDAGVEPMVTASAGEIKGVVLSQVSEADAPGGLWRLVIDIDGGTEPLIELSAHVAGYGRKLSEVWLYQWVRDVPAPVTEANSQIEG